MEGTSTKLAHETVARPPDPARRPPPELSVIVPTYNERQNIPILVERLSRALTGCEWEVLFVDDNSPDGSAFVARSLGRPTAGSAVCAVSVGAGLPARASKACWRVSPHVAVMDADLQHDATLLPPMLEQLRSDSFDLVVASRHFDGGSAASLSARRARISRWSNTLAQRLLGITLTDPMSGYFMIRREALEELAPTLSSEGFKILLDILATGRNRLRTVELATTFGIRHHGESKLDSKIALDFAALMTAKLTDNAVAARFVLFCLVGLTGVAVNLGALRALLAVTPSFGAALGSRHARRYCVEFRPQQLLHLQRPAAHRLALRHRPGSFRSHSRRRRDLQRRHRHLDLPLRRPLVARRTWRRADRRRMEFRGQRRLRLAYGVTAAFWLRMIKIASAPCFASQR